MGLHPSELWKFRHIEEHLRTKDPDLDAFLASLLTCRLPPWPTSGPAVWPGPIACLSTMPAIFSGEGLRLAWTLVRPLAGEGDVLI